MKTSKLNYRVHQMIGGQYSIIDNNHNIVFGGDSACEDHYNIDYMNDVFNHWDGSLNEEGLIDYDRISISFNTIQ